MLDQDIPPYTSVATQDGKNGVIEIHTRTQERALCEGQCGTVVIFNYRNSGELYRWELAVYPLFNKDGERVDAVALERGIRRGLGPRSARP